MNTQSDPRASRALLLTLPLALLSGCGPREARLVYPQPTEHVLDEDAEEEQSSLRKEWFEHRHQAGPDTDWRELERRNGEAQIEKRNRLGRLPGPADWTERGSENVAGRVHVSVPAPDGQSLYVGTALGGVWQGDGNGGDWQPFGDNLYGGAHFMAVVAGATVGAPDVVLIATEGGLVHVTRDHGATWEVPSGLNVVHSVERVLQAHDGSDAVFLLRRRNSSHKLLRSTDAMASFQEVLDLGTFDGDVWMTRDGNATLYAVTSTGVRRSTNLGDTWTSMGASPSGGTRAELTGSEAGAPRLWGVWTVGSLWKLYRSEDAGASWTFLSNLGSYWNELNASRTDPNLLLYGEVEAHRSTNGGGTFSVINTWSSYYSNPAIRLHADIQGIDVVPGPGGVGETWYISTDGGLYESTDGLTSVHNLSLSGLRISQYYSTLTSRANSGHVLAGAQDQGYQRAGTLPVGGTSFSFSQLISGDYGHLTSGDGDHDFVFSVYPGFVLIQVGETNPLLFQKDFPSGEDHAWMPPVVADPLDARHFFLCASHLYRYVKGGGNNWTSSQWSTFDFGIFPGEYVSALAFSPIDPQRAWVVTDRGRMYRSTDRGQSWTASTSTGPAGQYFYGTALLASRTDVDTVFVGGSGYSGPAIYRSTDGGVSFQSFSDGLPPTLVYCLGEAPDGSGSLFCGTETAAYRRDPGDAAWDDITGNQAPITVYWSVEALPNENTMRFGTYGRGIWDYAVRVRAKATFRNGSGSNPACLSNLALPVIGGTWSARIDPTLVPGTLTARLVVRPKVGVHVVPTGEVLAMGPASMQASQPADPDGNVFDFPIPNDVALVGLRSTAQAVLVGASSRRLGNALDLVLGY